MAPRLPVASYLFILRKHLLLMLGTMAVVLAAGWTYAATCRAVYRAVATVKIEAGSRGAGSGKASAREEGNFLSDQFWVIRTDDSLAERVLRHIRGEDRVPGGAGGAAVGGAEGASAGPSGAPREPPLPSPDLLRSLTPGEVRRMISIAPIPPTSYCTVTAQGPDPGIVYAVANGYARVFAEVFREKAEEEFRQSLGDRLRSRDRLAAKLEEANAAVTAFRKDNSRVDFSPVRGAIARETLDSLKKDLAQTRQRLYTVRREARTIEETLSAAGLSVRADGEGRKALHPPPAEPIGEDPRLSERVLALDVVAAHPRAQKSVEIIEEQEAEVRALLTGEAPKQPDSDVVRHAERRRDDERRRLARIVEAAVLKHALDLEQVELLEKDGAGQVKELENQLAAENAARAELDRLQEAALALRAEFEAVDGLVLEAERQRKAGEAEAGSVTVHAFARRGEAQLVSPDRPVIFGTTAALALLLAAALAYVLEYLDDTVKTREDFDRLVRLPFLGYVPHIRDAGKEGGPPSRDLVVALGRTGSPEVEAFRAIRTGIQFSRGDREVRTFLVTSAGPGEGKTTVSVNVATAFAGGKERVLLVDADLRRARIHSALGVDNGRGLTNVLVGEASLEECIQRSTVHGLDVLASGPVPPNPAEILGSERMQDLLRSAASRYGRVVVDSPPLVAVTDPALLAKYVDAVFLVISIGKTSIRNLQRARETLATVGVPVHGAVLNNADSRTSGYAAGYGYGYGYGGGAGGAAPDH
ncbi:MAG: polysaccharide biosynthesis tyrosine autokinase, partial [Planctomycetaceae bacterium]|nr:polysaccharide biosynthesis tyrosine autokinase [Planctomycetaceae bacterium]